MLFKDLADTFCLSATMAYIQGQAIKLDNVLQPYRFFPLKHREQPILVDNLTLVMGGIGAVALLRSLPSNPFSIFNI